MKRTVQTWRLAAAYRSLTLLIVLCCVAPGTAQDDKTLPASLAPEQRQNLLKFLKAHEKPERYVPKDSRIGDMAPSETDAKIVATAEKPIKQYTAQITPHRPVPGAEIVDKADVYFYRPNPAKGRQGLTVKYTVDLKTGEAIGMPEVLTKSHIALSREEIGEALEMAKAKVPALRALYKDREANQVRWEYLQMKINRKSAQYEPGDRVVRFVFMANPINGQPVPEPVRVVVNLTRDSAALDER